jgi:hypothetical protein
MVAVIKKQIARIEDRERQIFWAAFFMLAVLLVSYGFLMQRTILNAIAKEHMQENITALNTEVNTLEFQYLGMKNSITLDLAHARGFVAVAKDQFAAIASPETLSLSLKPNE